MAADQRRAARPRRGRSGGGRLRRSADFDRVYRHGRSHANRYLVMYAFPRGHDGQEPRLGVSVGRKVGGAVERNRVKRLLREAFAASSSGLPRDHDFVLVARPDAGLLARERGEPGVEQTLRELIAEAGLGNAGDERG
jgi:ribonuclease P protein component